MKKLFFSAIVLLFMACTEGSVDTSQQPPTTPDVEQGNPSQDRPTYFYASMEGTANRTELDELDYTCWTEADRITLFVGENYNREFEFDGETGDPSGGFYQVSNDAAFYTAHEVNGNYALYPHSKKNKLYLNDTNNPDGGAYFRTEFPATQTYKVNSFGVGSFLMVAATEDKQDTRLSFRNVCGCVKLLLYGTNQVVKSVSIQGNNDEYIAGRAYIRHSFGGTPTTEMISQYSTKTVSVSCAEGVTLGATAAEATEFWLSIPPTTFEQGFTITINGFYGGSITKKTTKVQTVGRNQFLNMPAFEVAIDSGATAMGVSGWGSGSDVSGSAE